VSQVLSCTVTNGSIKNPKVFTRDGARTAVRTGTRTGSHVGTHTGSRASTRTGTRSGSLAGVSTGTIGYDIDVDARKNSQYTGFIFNGWKGEPTYKDGATTWDSEAKFGDWSFGDYNFGDYTFNNYAFDTYDFGDYTFAPLADVQWGDWVAAPGETPSDCDRDANADKVSDYSNVVTPGAITDGAVADGPIVEGAVVPGDVTEGDVTEGVVQYGAVQYGLRTATGPKTLFVNGKAL
jgi:hypothetical protein